MSENYTYKLSVVIVNYNVEHFLDQCLDSVRRASVNCSLEVLIVDNNSVDGSLVMLAEKYPEYPVIANKENVGFSCANNQAMRIAKGEYVLLLNPDTVVAEDSFSKVITFMDEHPKAGGLGVHMIDGKGNFLPESKRGLPKPMVAFYKIFGLSKLFPNSKRFGQYHLGHIKEDETSKIDVLCGAFMLMRKSALDKVGLLDEDYFMYGEDIDLSYRIQKGGFDNYYFPETSIIHYKGESTKKSSVNYVFVFYKAMVIFARKHFAGKQAGLFSFLINAAIYLRAFLAVVSRILKRLFFPVIDFLYVTGGLFALTNYWKMSNIEFPEALIKYSIPIYAFVWIITSFFNGGYDFPIKLFKYVKSVLIATLIILVAYAILPKDYQFSRLFIFAGAGWTLVYFFVSRFFLHFAVGKRFRLFKTGKRSFAIVAKNEEFERIKVLISQTHSNIDEIDQVETQKEQLPQLSEIIFSAADNTYGEIIQRMRDWKSSDHDFKIAPTAGSVLIGSNSIDTAGDLYILNLNALSSTENVRKKRLFDVSFSIALILSIPITIFFFEKKGNFVRNLFRILSGKLTFIGYTDTEMKTDVRLPKIKVGVISPSEVIDSSNESIREKLNLLYARDYSMRKDFSILLKSWGKLDVSKV
ncbi:MAG: glycosyltransferase [Crocinitomicaceae bacterium]|nr:glycosyltransferase [Crocinitomicaceae bacterium]